GRSCARSDCPGRPGDLDQASRILRLVVAHGDPWQKAEARELLALIA
ncbi:FimV/HubP family polar landmark protein, partial [Pseudomonas aeruginosa]